MIKYPNLLEAAPYFPFAYFANSTEELLVEGIRGTEEFTVEEAGNMSRYTRIPYNVLFNTKLILLDHDREKHRRMIKALGEKFYEIWEWQKKGSREADTYMKYQRVAFVNLELDFQNRRPVAYCRYLGVKEQIDDALLFIRNEQAKINNKPRGVKRTAV